MRLVIAAVGRLGRGPEADLVADYCARARATGRPLGLAGPDIAEIDERKARDPAAQADRLGAAVPTGAAILALDQRGRALTSEAFAEMLGRLRDTGTPKACFLIGGADGLAPGLRDRADGLIAFGPMVWPHRLVRVMLAEQIYRAVSILAGGPYHRA